MPSHQDRVRAKNPEMNCDHIFIYKMNSDKAPFIMKDGSRTSIRVCINCGKEEQYNRSQKQFEKELELFNIYDRITR